MYYCIEISPYYNHADRAKLEQIALEIPSMYETDELNAKAMELNELYNVKAFVVVAE